MHSTMSLLPFGIEPEWLASSPEIDGLVSWRGMTGGHQWIMWTAITIAVTLSISGLISLQRRNRQAFWLAISIFIGAGIFTITASTSGLYFYPRFVIPVLPVFVIAMATGAWQLATSLKGPGSRTSWLIAAGLVMIYFATCWPQIKVLQNRSYAPLREVAAFLKEQEAIHGKTIAVGYGLGGRILKSYYQPTQYELYSPTDEALRRLLVRSAETNSPLYVFYGYPAFNRAALPEGFELLDNPKLFEEVAAFRGIEPEFYFRVLKSIQQASHQ